MVLPKAAAVRAREIGQADLSDVCALLAEEFPRRPRSFWAAVFAQLAQRPSNMHLPRFGYLLDADGAAVGAILTIFSCRENGSRHSTRCNLSSWCVKPAFRPYASLLV